MGKLLTFDSLVSKIEDKIDLLRRYGKDVSSYQARLEEIVNGNVSYPPFLDESKSSRTTALTMELKYEEKMKALRKLKAELENYEKYVVIYFKNASLSNEISKVDLSTDLYKYVKQAKSLLNDIESVDYSDTDEEKNLTKEVYKTIYELIKLELIANNKSTLLKYLSNNNKGIEFINDLVREDLEKYDLDREENIDLKTRVLELSSKGMNYNYADEDLILILLVKSDKRILENINVKIEKLKKQNSQYNVEIYDLNEDKRALNTSKKLYIGRKKNARIKGIITAGFMLLNIISYKIGGNVVKSSNTDITYMTTREVYDTYTGEVKSNSELEYKSGNNSVYIKEYGEVRKSGNRDLKTYSLEDIKYEDIKDYGTDTELSGGSTTSSIKYMSAEQLTKESYRIIEKVTYSEEPNIEFDEINYNKTMNVMSYILYGLGSIEALMILRYLIISISNRHKAKASDMNMVIIDNKLNNCSEQIKSNEKAIQELENIKEDFDGEQYIKLIR